MNWYKLVKTSALEQQWWIRFFEHLSKTAMHIFNDDIHVLNQQSFSSGVDGPKLFFSYNVVSEAKQVSYSCHIGLILSEHVGAGKSKWQNAKMLSFESGPNQTLLRSEWFVIKGERGEQECIGQGMFAPQDSTPAHLTERIRQCILNDDKEDEDGLEPQPEAPKPPSKKKAPPVKQPITPFVPQLVGV